MHIWQCLGCACQDVLVFCLQVVNVVAKSYSGARMAPESEQDPAAGMVPQSGQAPGDPTTGGISAAGEVHKGGQGMGNPAAGSRIPLEQAPEISLASSSSGSVAQTSIAQASRATSSNAVAVEAFQAAQPRQGSAGSRIPQEQAPEVSSASSSSEGVAQTSKQAYGAASSSSAAVEAFQAAQPRQGSAPTSDAAAVETRQVVQPLETFATCSNAVAAGGRQVVQPPLTLYSPTAAAGDRQAVQPPLSLAPSSSPATAEGCHAVQSRHGGTAAGQAPSSHPTAMNELATGQQPAHLAARQAAQVGLVPAMPGTGPLVGIVTKRQPDAQVGLIRAVGCQEAL